MMKISDNNKLGLWRNCELGEGEVLKMEKVGGMARKIVVMGAGERRYGGKDGGVLFHPECGIFKFGELYDYCFKDHTLPRLSWYGYDVAKMPEDFFKSEGEVQKEDEMTVVTFGYENIVEILKLIQRTGEFNFEELLLVKEAANKVKVTLMPFIGVEKNGVGNYRQIIFAKQLKRALVSLMEVGYEGKKAIFVVVFWAKWRSLDWVSNGRTDWNNESLMWTDYKEVEEKLPKLVRVRCSPCKDDPELVRMVLTGEDGYVEEKCEKHKLIDVVMELLEVIGKYVTLREAKEYIKVWYESWMKLFN